MRKRTGGTREQGIRKSVEGVSNGVSNFDTCVYGLLRNVDCWVAATS